VLPLEVASPTSFDLRWPSFSGPYSRLLGMRSEGWSKRYEECMSASAEAQNDLENIEASVGDLIPVSPVKKAKVQMARSRDFGPSLMTEEAIKALEDEGCFLAGKGCPSHGETSEICALSYSGVSPGRYQCPNMVYQID